jgi:hypothetical protein
MMKSSGFAVGVPGGRAFTITPNVLTEEMHLFSDNNVSFGATIDEEATTGALLFTENNDPSYWTQLPADDEWEWPSRKECVINYPKPMFSLSLGREPDDVNQVSTDVGTSLYEYDNTIPSDEDTIKIKYQAPAVSADFAAGVVPGPGVSYDQWGDRNKRTFNFPLFLNFQFDNRFDVRYLENDYHTTNPIAPIYNDPISRAQGEEWILEYLMSAEEYVKIIFSRRVRIGEDVFFVTNIDGFDAAGRNPAELRLLRIRPEKLD